MIRLLNQPSIFLAVLVLLSSSVWAGEPNASATVLRFEVSSASIRFPRGGPLASWKPLYAVGIPLDGPTAYLPGLGEMGDHDFHMAAERSTKLSPRQKELLEAMHSVLPLESLLSFRFHRPEDPNQPRELLLYAMTLEDAKGLAQTYVDSAMGAFGGWVQAQKDHLKASEEIAAALEKKMQELEATVRNADASVAEIQKRVGYRTQEEATAAIAELDRMRNAAQVDIAGILAKIAAVQKWQAENHTQSLLDRLKAIFMEEAIALEAAEARRKMAMQLREDASKFCDARQILDNIGAEKEKLLGEISENRNSADATREWLQGSGKLRPQIADRTITIYPVEWMVSGADLLDLSIK